MPVFSIVMPSYNNEKYIEDAITSIQAQSFDDWELIVVDDASPDASNRIIEKMAQADGRIRLLQHDSNKGPGAARNTGIDAACGEYIWFADSDDAFDPSLLEDAYRQIQQTHADMIMFGLVEDYYDSSGAFLYANEMPIEAGDYPDISSWKDKVLEWERDTHFGYGATKIYKLALIRDADIRFTPVKLSEDYFFNVAFFKHMSRMATLSGTPYHYRKMDGRSLTNANSYTAREYFEVQQRRILDMKELLEQLDAFDDAAKSTLGALFGRYILSALERTYMDGEDFSKKERIAWCEEIMDTDLFKELMPYARSRGSRSLDITLDALRGGRAKRCVLIAKAAHFARQNMYGLFTRFRSER